MMELTYQQISDAALALERWQPIGASRKVLFRWNRNLTKFTAAKDEIDFEKKQLMFAKVSDKGKRMEANVALMTTAENAEYENAVKDLMKQTMKVEVHQIPLKEPTGDEVAFDETKIIVPPPVMSRLIDIVLIEA